MGSNIAEPLRLIFLLSVPALKSTGLREGGLTKVGIQTHPSRPPPPPYLFTPVGPSHPIRGSVSVLSMDPSRGSSPPGKGVDTEVSIPTEVPLSSVACQVAQSSGQLMNTQVGPIVATSGLNAAQAEEIFLFSHEVQTLCGKLALDFIQLSHTEATFRMGAQATSHEYTVQEHPSTGRRGCGHTAYGRRNLVAHQFFTLLSHY